MLEPKILVTAATGTVGSAVMRWLRRSGHEAVAAVRDVERAKAQLGEATACVRFDFTAPETFRLAFSGVRKLFLVRPPSIADVGRFINPAIDAARAAGVEHVVFLSVLGAEKNPLVPHRQIEKHLMASGLAFTLLRPSYFMQNLSTTHRADLQERDEVFVPAGHGKTSFTDARDVAAAAAKVLTEDGHAGRAYALTGGEALSYNAVARTLSDVLGRQIVYADPSPLRFAFRMYRRGLPPTFILVMIGIYTAARFGFAATVTPELEHLLRRPPTSFRAFAKAYRACWEPSTARPALDAESVHPSG